MSTKVRVDGTIETDDGGLIFIPNYMERTQIPDGKQIFWDDLDWRADKYLGMHDIIPIKEEKMQRRLEER